jgi:sugar phosphate isomerase/epimerase
MNTFSRRDFMSYTAAGLGVLACVGASRDALALDTPFLFQTHSLRDWFIRDFAGTLKELREVGYTGMEITSFHGFRGNLRGDYGPLTDMPPAKIRKIISDSGLSCESSHFMAKEFEDAGFGAAVDWAQGVGLKYMVATGLPTAKTAAEWQQQFEWMNRVGERLRREGLRLGFHTDASVWTRYDGKLAMDEMLRTVPDENCLQQLDLAGVIEHDVDAGAYLSAHPGRFYWLHLRDGVKPAEAGAYLPALVPGQGVINWKSVMAGARDAGVKSYIVEMQVRPVEGSMDAFKASYTYLRAMTL